MRTSLVALLLLALAACGRGGSADQPQAAAAGTGTTATAASPAAEAVAAVLQSAGTPLARLQFVIGERPVAGVAFPINLLATAAAGAEPATVRLTAESDGLILQEASAVLALGAAGDPATHAVTARAAGEGLYEVTVRLVVDADLPATVYVIPVLVAAAAASDEADPPAQADHAGP